MKRKVVTTFFEILPLFAGFFAIQSKPAPYNLEEYLGRYLCFILLFASWICFREIAPKLFPQDGMHGRASVLKILAVILMGLVMVGAILLFQHRTNTIMYELALMLIGVNAFAIRFYSTDRFKRFWMLAFAYYTGLAYLSFQMAFFSLDWHALVFSAAFAGPPLSLMIAHKLEDAKGDCGDLLALLLRLSLYIGPLAVGILVMTNDLPAPYLLSFAIIAITARIQFNANAQNFNSAAILSLLFIVNLGVLAILT